MLLFLKKDKIIPNSSKKFGTEYEHFFRFLYLDEK